ncbi:MAG: hypothetical protein ACTHLU_07485 [Novosphingobium sp.]|jgi:hypothetical protein
MSEFVTRDVLRTAATIVPAPGATPQVRAEIDRTFELPTGIYVATAGLYLGFIGVMAATFGNAGLAIPLVIFALFVVAGFGTPALWARMNPAKTRGALTFGQLESRGIVTATGRLGAGAAAAQVLVLPVLIFVWGLAIAVIAALT